MSSSSTINQLITCVLGRGCPAAVAASIIAAYCSGDGLYDGIGSLFGLFVGGADAIIIIQTFIIY